LAEQEVILPPVLVGDATNPATLRGNSTGPENPKAGGRSVIDRVNVALTLRALDDAMSVTVAELKTDVGVPAIVQPSWLDVRESPFGRNGDVVQETIAPPVLVATSCSISVPTLPERVGEFRLSTGAELPTLSRRRRKALP